MVFPTVSANGPLTGTHLSHSMTTTCLRRARRFPARCPDTGGGPAAPPGRGAPAQAPLLAALHFPFLLLALTLPETFARALCPQPSVLAMLRLPALSLTRARASYWGAGGRGMWTQKRSDVLAEGGSEPSKEQVPWPGPGALGRRTRESEEGRRPASLRYRCGRVCMRGVQGGARRGGGRECDTPRPGRAGSRQRLGWAQRGHFQP